MESLYDIKANKADVLNDYVTSPNRVKIWRVLSQGFEGDAGKSVIIVEAL